MARPIVFPEANQALFSGGNPDTSNMPVCLATRPAVTGGMPYYLSKWQLGDEEIEEIKKTGCVYICIMHTPVPISVHGLNPFNYKIDNEPEFQPIKKNEN